MPDYLPHGLGVSFDKIAGNPHVDRRVPLHVRKYLYERSTKSEVRKQIALRAFKKVEKYRLRLEAQNKRWSFRLHYYIWTHPESKR